MLKTFLLATLCLYTTTMHAKNEEKNTVKANLQAVTVYRVGAEMNHLAKGDLIKGNNELIIENISNALDVNSIQVNCNGNVTLMGVEFSTNFLQNEMKTPLIKKLEDSVEEVTELIEKNKLNANIITDLLSVLKANKEIKGTQVGLSVAELVKMMDYYKAKSTELQNELATLAQKQKKLTGLSDKLHKQIAEEEKKNTKTAGRLILQLNCSIAGKYDFIISYITPNAYWQPFYDLKAPNITSPLKITYRAKIFQTTGIDWKQVKLSLSTSTPTQTGNAPVFNAWFLSYINPVRNYEQGMSVSNSIQSFAQPLAGGQKDAALSEVVVIGYGAKIRGLSEMEEDSPPLYIVNGTEMTANEYAKIRQSAIKKIEVVKGGDATAIYGSRAGNGAIVVTLKDGLDDYITVSDKELDVTFDIDLPYDVPTSGKAQTAVLKEYDVPAKYKYYAVPKLDKEVFLLAEITDWGKLNLLPGEANIIFEGTYIGKSFIDPSSTQDTLNLTMGRDKRVVVKREKLMDFSSVKFLGTNKKQTFTYEITVKNNKKDPIDILVKEQYPISQNKEVEVELLEKAGAVVNEEIGVLTWKLQLAPGEVKKLRISYSVRYPKDKVLNLN
jgi:TonB-dependent SusC/RagA subfamily outer membrane receptor